MQLSLRPNKYGVFCTSFRATISFEEVKQGGYEGTRSDYTKLLTKLQERGHLGGVADNTNPNHDATIFIEPNAWNLDWAEYRQIFDIFAQYTDRLTPAELADEQFVWKCGGRKTENHKAVEAI